MGDEPWVIALKPSGSKDPAGRMITMFDDDAIRFPQFTTYFFESLVQLPWPSVLPISTQKSGDLPTFPAFEPDDDIVTITLTMPEYRLSIPYHHPSVYPFPLSVKQYLNLTFQPWLEADDPLFLDEDEGFVLIKVHMDLTLAQDLICLDSDVPQMIRTYTTKAEQCFQSILMPGAPVRVSITTVARACLQS